MTASRPTSNIVNENGKCQHFGGSIYLVVLLNVRRTASSWQLVDASDRRCSGAEPSRGGEMHGVTYYEQDLSIFKTFQWYLSVTQLPLLHWKWMTLQVSLNWE